METATKPATAPPKSKLEKTHQALGTVSTALGILGAAGTLFVWVAANYYVGDVEIHFQGSAPGSVAVRVYDNKGHESLFHTTSFQITPGAYELEISADGSKPVRAPAVVRFHDRAVVEVTLDSAGEKSPERPGRRPWWRFWRSES
jgi:hypothetical protein